MPERAFRCWRVLCHTPDTVSFRRAFTPEATATTPAAARLLGVQKEGVTMKYIPLIAIAAIILATGCTVATSERVVEKPVPVASERTVVYSDPASASTTTVYTR